MHLFPIIIVGALLGLLLWNQHVRRRKKTVGEAVGRSSSAGALANEPWTKDDLLTAVKTGFESSCERWVRSNQLLGTPMETLVHGQDLWVFYHYRGLANGSAHGLTRIGLSDRMVRHYLHEGEESLDVSCMVSAGALLWVATDQGFRVRRGDDEGWTAIPRAGPWATWRFTAGCHVAGRTVFVAEAGAVDVHLDGIVAPMLFASPMRSAPTVALALGPDKVLVLADEEGARSRILDLSIGEIAMTDCMLPPYPQTADRLSTGQLIVGASGNLTFLNPTGDGPACDPEALRGYELAKMLSGGGQYSLITGIRALEFGQFSLIWVTGLHGIWAQLIPGGATRVGQKEFSLRLLAAAEVHVRDVHLDAQRGRCCYGLTLVDSRIFFCSDDIFSIELSTLRTLLAQYPVWEQLR
jgi:hypothetical protein